MTEAASIFAQALARHKAGDAPGAATLYRQGLKLNDTNADAWHLLGVALLQTGETAPAITAIERALLLRSGFAEAQGNLGTALQTAGRLEEAEAALRGAIALSPGTAPFHYNLGNLLLATRRLADAVNCFREAIQRQPLYPEAHSNLGSALRDLEQLDAATASFEAAVSQKPDYAEARYNLANAYRDQGRLSAAEAEIRKVVAQRPTAKGFNSLGVILSDQGRSADAVGAFAAAMAHDADYMPAASNWLSAQQYVPGVTEEGLARAHGQWVTRHVPASSPTTPELRDQVPITVGFISPDFGVHPVGLLSVRMFENLDPARLRAVVFSTRARAGRRYQRAHRQSGGVAAGRRVFDRGADAGCSRRGRPDPVRHVRSYRGPPARPVRREGRADPDQLAGICRHHRSSRHGLCACRCDSGACGNRGALQRKDHPSAPWLRMLRPAGGYRLCAHASRGEKRAHHVRQLQQPREAERRSDRKLWADIDARSWEQTPPEVPRP